MSSINAARPSVSLGRLVATGIFSVAGVPAGRINPGVDIRQTFQRGQNQGADLIPIQPAKTAPQRRDGNGLDVFLADDAHQIAQARFNVVQSGLAAPVTLGGEVDNVARIGKLPGVHTTNISAGDNRALF